MRSIVSVYMPYHLRALEPDIWVLLNREYKPLGCFESIIMYDYLQFAFYSKISHSKLLQMKCEHSEIRRAYGCEDGGYLMLWLYCDQCSPDRGKDYMTKYLKRLAILGKIGLSQSNFPEPVSKYKAKNPISAIDRDGEVFYRKPILCHKPIISGETDV